ncbi:MAG: hypothetical protein SVR04_08260 [Spirochaetota bacterium]|nr:hypothetical protein [Spirochaetota bacterium]
MNISRKFKLILISASALLLFAGCDLFVLGPSLNLNYDDDDAAFGRLGAALVDDGDVRVGWDWYDLERILPGRNLDPIYDKIIIQHSTGSYPVSRLGGRKFEISEWDPVTNPLWSTVFKDLKYDREHYFALYAHERNGRWMAPLYASVYFDGYDSYPIFPGAPTNISANFSGGTHAPGAINADQADICYYDLGGDELVASAVMTLDITAAPASDDHIIIYPMRQRWDVANFTDIDLGGVDQFAVDRSIRAEIPVTASFTGMLYPDITEVFAKAQYHGTKGILIQTSGQDMTITSPPMIEVEVVRKW